MNEDLNKISENNTGVNIDKEVLRNLTSSLTKNENSIDLSSIMKVATTLLKNDTVRNSISGIARSTESPVEPKTADSKSENTELSALTTQLEKIANDISGLKETISELNSVSHKLEGLAKDITQLKNDLHEIKQQNNKYISKQAKKDKKKK